MRCMLCGSDMKREKTIFENNEPVAEMWRCPKCESGFNVNLRNRWVKPL